MRHAQAGWDAPSDRERTLTQVGEDQAKRAAESIATYAAVPARIVHSPWLRTTQTAHIIARQLGDIPCEADEALAPDADVRLWSQCWQTDGDLVISHQPMVSAYLSWLCEASLQARWPMEPASWAVLSAEVFEMGCGRLLQLRHASDFDRSDI